MAAVFPTIGFRIVHGSTVQVLAKSLIFDEKTYFFLMCPRFNEF